MYKKENMNLFNNLIMGGGEVDKFRRIIGLLLIVVGITIIATVVYKKVETIGKQKAIIEMFESGISEGTSTGNKETVNLDEINGYSYNRDTKHKIISSIS